MPITFDGPNRIIRLAASDSVVEVSEIYSDWKDWALSGDNLKYPPAFRPVGGDPVGGGVFTGINTFIRNDLGWRIKPPEQNILIELVGNLFPEDPDEPWRTGPDGNFTTAISTNNSANALIVAGSGGGGTTDPDDVAQAVWEATADDWPEGSTGDRVGRVLTVARFLGLR
jgi:hypothetical protein